MRKCRKMISVIMLMVMLVSLLPSGALAAEAPTGATNEVAAVEEPTEVEPATGETEETLPAETKTDGTENEGDNETTITEGTSEGASVSDATESTGEATDSGTNEIATVEEPSENSSGSATEAAGIGETSVEIAPVVEPVEKEAKDAGETNLYDYVVTQNGGTVKLILVDKNNNVLQQNSNGEYDVYTANNPYKLTFQAQVKKFAPGVYTYQFPKLFTYSLGDANPKIVLNGKEIATYEITSDGLLTATFNEEANNAQDITTSFTFDINFGGTDNSLEKIGDITVRIHQPGTGVPSFDKVGVSISGSTLNWRTAVTCDEKANAVGLKVTDAVDTTNKHFFTQADQDKGVTVTASHGSDSVSWKLTKNGNGFEWVNKTGWTYTIPESYNGKTFGPGWDFTFSYSTTIETVDDSRIIGYRNWAYLYNNNSLIKRDDGVNERSPGVGDARKYGSFEGENGQKEYIHWSLYATVKNIAPTDTFRFCDVMLLYPSGNSGQADPLSLTKDKYPEMQDFEATITFIDNTGKKVEEKLPVRMKGSTDTSTSPSGYYLSTTGIGQSTENWLSNKRSPKVWFYVYNKNVQDGSGLSGWTRIDLSYKTKLTTEYLKIIEDNKIVTTSNAIWVYRNSDYLGFARKWLDFQPNRKKTTHFPAKANNDNYKASFQINYTPADEDVDKYDNIIIEDTMSNTLSYVPKSAKVTAKDNNGNLLENINFTETYENHVLTIKIIDPKRYDYVITYDAFTSNNPQDAIADGTIPFNNEFIAVVNGEKTNVIETSGKLSDWDGEAHQYSVTINKVDETNKPLAGAKFAAYLEDGTLAFKPKATNAQGEVTFTTNVDDDIMYIQNTPYYIQETEAPARYKLNTTKYWFVVLDTNFPHPENADTEEYWKDYFENTVGAKEGEYKIIKPTYTSGGSSSTGSIDFTVENKAEDIQLTVNKKWDDADNANNTRPASISIQLKADNVNEGSAVTVTAEDNWSHTWKKLKKYNAKGELIKYTVSEETVPGYEAPVTGNPEEVKDSNGNLIGYTIEITNKRIATTEVPVEKVWNDKKTQHNSVTVKLYANNTDTGKTLELNETNGFKGKFTNLTKYDTSNKEIVYTVKEDKVDGYATVITGSAAEGYKITNTPITNIAVEKIWNDANDQDRKRPTSITVKLKKNGTVLYSAALTAASNWKGHTWSNLPVYDEDGNEITYSVEEETVTGYAAGEPVKSETTDKNGVTTVTYTITNTYSPDTVNAKVRKIWADDNNADGLRTSIEVQLTKNGTPMTGDAYKQTLNKANNWTYDWTGLPANDAGVPITYSVMEITQVNGYTTSKPAAVYDEATKTWNISVTNTHDRIPTKIPVEKVWRDDKTQHGSITVKLLKGGDDTGKTLELNEANGFKGEFTGLPKFENEGKEIEYTIEEVEVTGYTTAITGSAAEGFKITNTILTNIAVEKVWDDANDQDRKRPASITVHLTKNGAAMEGDDYTATLKAEENWKGYTWSDLPAYDEDGKKITYSVTEDPIAEYTAGNPVKKSETADGTTGVKTVTYSIKNSYTPGTVHAKVVKSWDDNNDQDGLRTSIEVQLTKNGDPMTGDAYKQTLNEANNWTYEWSELPENTDGVQNTYSIVEISTVTGYEQTTKPETSYDEASKTWNISVTNTHTPIKTEASVTKVWDDGNNIEGLQPKEIKVQLLDATGDKEIPVRDEVTLNAGNKWTYTWTGLDKFKEKGTEIKYTVREVSVPEGYTDEVKVVKDLEGKFKITVTNKHGGRPVSISKTDITNSKEVEGATLQILLNNEVVTAKDEKGKDARAEWTSTKEPHKVYGLTPGVTYTLRETIQPEGFTIIEADTTFSVDKNGIVTATGSKVKDNIILVEDAPTFVKVKKVDATSQEEVEGAHIQILDGDEVFDEWDSKKGVVHEVKYLVADKKYTLRETVAPLGYTVISDTEFTVNNKNEVTYKGETVSETIDGVPVILVEDTMTIVKISKTDITGEKELKGATLQILDDKGEVVTVKDRKGNDVKCEWVSTDEPHVVEGLEINKTYTLRETISPDGYTIATDATFSIDEKNRITTEMPRNSAGVLLVKDAPTKVYISKTDINSGDELPGATMQILDEKENVVVIKDNDGNPVETLEWVSGEEPKYIEGLPTGVNYILRETISPDGYTIASDTKFTIDEKGVVTSDGTTSVAEDGTTVLVVEDDLTTVQISKVDAQSEKELEGAKLQIIDEENNIVEEWTSTKEVHVVRGLVANKKYILREQVAPLGYTLTSDTTFSIDMNNVVTSTGPVNKDGVILVNDTMTEVEILKVDSKTGKGLAGAKLQVLDDNGAVCDEWTSTKDAHKIRGLYTGVKYTLHEVEAPKGYDKAKDITFTIDTAGKVSSDALDNGKIVMKDTPTPKKNKTGDEANGSLWALLLMMASGALGGTVWFKRKRRV